MNRIAVIGAGVAVAIATLLSAGELQAQANSTEQSFVSGGAIQVNLESGGYDIRPGADNRIRVTWDRREGVKVAVNVNGSHAVVTVANTPHNNFHATIEMPERSDIRIRLTAGDLHVGRIEGSKDIESNAGNVEVTVGDPKDYAKVNASVRAGDLDASPFNVSKGGLFRSFNWAGPGKYFLRVRLIAGDLVLKK